MRMIGPDLQLLAMAQRRELGNFWRPGTHGGHIHNPPPPVSNVYVYITSALPPVFTLIGISTAPPNN